MQNNKVVNDRPNPLATSIFTLAHAQHKHTQLEADMHSQLPLRYSPKPCQEFPGRAFVKGFMPFKCSITVILASSC